MEEAMEEASAPPWKRWLPSAGSECERLPAPAQHLLAFAAALFHAPAVARSRRFAEEVFAFSEGDTPRARPSSDAAHAAARREARRRSRLADERRGIEGERDASDSFTARSARVADAGAAGSELDAPTSSHPTREQQSARGVGESAPPKPSAHGPTNESPVEETASDFPVVVEDAREAGAHVAAWADLEGCETRLGGALFLLNLFTGLRLPECFDEDYQLSEHITGWGLAELLARALLGEACAEFERDPLWVALARLDGRAEGEPPAPALRVGESYRAPARWLKLFAPRDEEWVVCEDEWRLVLLHSGCFPVAVQPLNGLTPLEAAARLADEYRAQGVSVARLEPAPAPDARAALRRAGLSPPFERFSFFDQLFADGGGASLSADLRRWMGWTFSFLKYALGRSLAGEDGADTEEAMREMLVRRGRLYCTATHVDLVMEMSGVSLAARRAGFDASPGWVRDLVRVVAYHYE
jgi:hypothetical protein